MKPLTVRPSTPVEMEATGITPDAKMSEALARMHNRYARARGTWSVALNVSVRSAQQEGQQVASHIGARCTACPLCSSRRRAATCAASSRSAWTQATPKLSLKPRAAKMLQPRILSAKKGDPWGLCAGTRARRPAAHPHYRDVVRLRTRVRGPPRAPRCLLRTALCAACCMVGAPSLRLCMLSARATLTMRGFSVARAGRTQSSCWTSAVRALSLFRSRRGLRS
jgi:hypothetical protein